MNPFFAKSAFSPRHWQMMTAVLLLGWLLHIAALGADARFHPDEALYMTAARSAAVQGDWLLVTVPQDKPPLTMYLNALSLVFFSTDTDAAGVLHLDALQGEFAGRLMSLWAALLLIAVVMALAQRLFCDVRVMLVAGLVTALSPYMVAYGATAFTDMPMTLFGMISVLCALHGHAGSAGVLSFMAFASKPQGIAYLPLVLLILWRAGAIRPLIGLVPWLIGGLLLWAWDAARVAQGAVDVWTLGQANYATPALTPLAEWGTRLRQWADYGRGLFGDVLMLPLIIGAIWTTRTIYRRGTTRTNTINRRGTIYCAPTHKYIPIILLLWCVAYTLVHLLTTVPLYDRYLLPLAPMLALLGAYGVVELGRVLKWRWAYKGLLIVSAGILLLYAVMAAQQRLHIGGDLGQHAGIDQLANYLNQKPIATVIYDPWLGWELSYYLGPWTNKRRVHYPTPQTLVEDALQLEETGTRYFVAPQREDITGWLESLERAGFRTTTDAEIGQFVVIALTPPTH